MSSSPRHSSATAKGSWRVAEGGTSASSSQVQIAIDPQAPSGSYRAAPAQPSELVIWQLPPWNATALASVVISVIRARASSLAIPTC
jgi:hypothetical protein